MKSKLLFVVLASIIFIYAGCKKSSPKPAVSTLSPQDAASEMVLNLSQSLFGDLGAFNVSDGLGSTSSFSVRTGAPGFALHPNKSVFSLRTNGTAFGLKSRRHTIFTLANPVCGAVIDTTVNESDTSDGLTIGFAGEVKFTFNCTNNVVSGFTTADNVTITIGTADTSFSYKVGENLTLAEVNPANASTNLSLNGTLNSSLSYQIKTGASKGSGTASFDYTLTSVIVSQTTGVVSGSATFNTQASGPLGTWSYQGTITFLGDDIATVTINGVTYNVNMDTGTVS